MTIATIQGRTHVIYSNRRIVISLSTPCRVMAWHPDTPHCLSGRMGCNPSLKQGQGMALSGSADVPSLAWSGMTEVQAQGKGKARHLRRATSTLGFFLFLPSVNPLLPFVYKWEGRTPHEKGGSARHTTHHARSQAATKLLASF